jgi:hypothetical protein
MSNDAQCTQMQTLPPADSLFRIDLLPFLRPHKCSTCTERGQCENRILDEADPLEPVNQGIESALGHFLQKTTTLERYVYLIRLADRNVALFDKLVMYVLPVISIAIGLTKPERVTAELLIEAARAIGDQVATDILDEDDLFPPPRSETFKRELQAAARVAQLIFDAGLATVDRPVDIGSWLVEQASRPTVLNQINRATLNSFVDHDQLIEGVFSPNDVVSDVFVLLAQCDCRAA